jgi:hypothetical protein
MGKRQRLLTTPGWSGPSVLKAALQTSAVVAAWMTVWAWHGVGRLRALM